MTQLRDQSDKIQIALWGVGGHARDTVLPAIAACSSLKLVGIGTRNDEVRAQQAELYQCRAWSCLEDILSCSEVEVVFLATPIGLHHHEGLQVLESRRHLWCEKSLTSSLAEAEEIFKIAESTDRSLCVVCGPLYHAQFRKISDLIHQGVVGKIQSVTGFFEFPHMSGDNIRYDPDIGGSALLDLGFYPIVVLNELGSSEIVSSSARLEYERGYRIDTSGEAAFTTESGLHLKSYWGYGRDYRNEITIQGELGSLHVSPAFSKPKERDYSIELKTGKSTIQIPVPPENQFVTMLQSFCETIGQAEERNRQRNWALQTQRLLDRISSCAV